MTSRKWVAGALAATGALHLILAPEYLEEQAYIGALFIAGGLTALALAVVLWRHENALCLVLGTVVALGMAIGFVLSRTTGLPGFHESEWELSGLISLGLEAVVVLGATRLLPASAGGSMEVGTGT